MVPLSLWPSLTVPPSQPVPQCRARTCRSRHVDIHLAGKHNRRPVIFHTLAVSGMLRTPSCAVVALDNQATAVGETAAGDIAAAAAPAAALRKQFRVEPDL